MKTKEFNLSNHFTLIAHYKCSVFVDTSDPNKYILVDWDHDPLAFIFISDHTLKL